MSYSHITIEMRFRRKALAAAASVRLAVKAKATSE
jgi:hypothetical protein